MRIFQHKFVEYIPDVLEEGVLYITVEYRTAVHRCFCGCGNKIITPISPDFWTLTFNGKAISLYPSIGSRNLECKSHYYLRNNNVLWLDSFDSNVESTYHMPAKKIAEKRKSFFRRKRKK